MLTPDAALKRILTALKDLSPLCAERVPLAEALGRALREDVLAQADIPPFHASTMDGYALRAADAKRPGARLKVAFEVFAGQSGPGPLPPGTCCRITTGAPLPEGADAVEMQEEVRSSGGQVIFRRSVESGRFVKGRASDLAKGARAVLSGTVVDPGVVGLLAGLNRTEVLVGQRPRVALLPTGDELLAAGTTSGDGKIVESNGHALAAAVLDAGGIPILLPAAGDSAQALKEAILSAQGCDALVTTGGVSVGPRDLVRSAFTAAGVELDFWGVSIKPGKPFTFGRWDRKAVFGVPGNPASAMVTFELFVRPALRALAGLRGSGRFVTTAFLAEAHTKPKDITVYVRVKLSKEHRGLVAVPLRTQLSGHLSSAAGHDGFAILPAGRERVPRGARVEVRVVRAPVDD